MENKNVLMELVYLREEIAKGYYDQNWVKENVKVSCTFADNETNNVRVKEASFHMLADHILGIRMLIEADKPLKLEHEANICSFGSGNNEEQQLIIRFYGYEGGEDTVIKLSVKKSDCYLFKTIERCREFIITKLEPYDNKLLVYGIYTENMSYEFMRSQNNKKVIPIIGPKEIQETDKDTNNELVAMIKEILTRTIYNEERLEKLSMEVEWLNDELMNRNMED